MSTYDSNLEPPFDDSVQLAEMHDDSDDLPIVVNPVNGERNVTPINTADVPVVTMVTNTGDQISKKRGYAIVAILFFINLLNYMDRFTIAGNFMKYLINFDQFSGIFMLPTFRSSPQTLGGQTQSPLGPPLLTLNK